MKKIIMIFILLSISLFAKDYALIISISEYKTLGTLDIKKDIDNYKFILKEQFGITKIDTLTNKAVTKKAILDKLDHIKKLVKDKKIDRFFLVFIGHGLNKSDKSYGEVIQKDKKIMELLKNTGAILAQDFNKKKIKDTIIIGKEDIKPKLSVINKNLNSNKKSFIIFDSCFSKNGIMLPKSTPSVLVEDKKKYPYNNIIYIGASTGLSTTGLLSPILKKCINSKTNTFESLKTCMDKNINKQRVIFFSKNYDSKLF